MRSSSLLLGLSLAGVSFVLTGCSGGDGTSSTTPPPAPSSDAGATSSGTCAGPRPGGHAAEFLFSCSMVCDPGRADCNGNVDDGCEVDRLHDPQNCGMCGAVATSCTNGLAGPAAEELFECGNTVEGIAVDATNVYAMCDGALRATPKSGGPATKLAEGEWTYRGAGLQIVDGFLYWAWRSEAKTGQVRRMPVGGGPIETVMSNLNPGSNVVVHAGVAYVIDAVFEKPAHGRVVDSTGRTILECDPSGSLAVVGDLLYVTDHQGVHAVGFGGENPKLVSLLVGNGVLATNADTLAIAGKKLATYQPGTGITEQSTLGLQRVNGALVSSNGTVWVSGTARVDGELLGGDSVLVSVDPSSHQPSVRASVKQNATFLNPGRAIGPLAEDESFVYFAASGTLAKPGTVSRVAK